MTLVIIELTLQGYLRGRRQRETPWRLHPQVQCSRQDLPYASLLTRLLRILYL
jgi:hypothetical protein